MKWYVELIIEEDGNEGYRGHCPKVPGVHAGGLTADETFKNLCFEIEKHLSSGLVQDSKARFPQEEDYG